jgi:hypothetical protein
MTPSSWFNISRTILSLTLLGFRISKHLYPAQTSPPRRTRPFEPLVRSEFQMENTALRTTVPIRISNKSFLESEAHAKYEIILVPNM